MQQSYENIQDEFDNAYCASYLPEYSGTSLEDAAWMFNMYTKQDYVM